MGYQGRLDVRVCQQLRTSCLLLRRHSPSTQSQCNLRSAFPFVDPMCSNPALLDLAGQSGTKQTTTKLTPLSSTPGQNQRLTTHTRAVYSFQRESDSCVLLGLV